ncbi:hypothetical protein AB0A76_35400 [Streptomyces exfoliatus]|uniref:MalT-like TPR region domain-containing protein n=1 Tax=Streptomyces exfoliatus TaxID=1905 RepID=A0ABV3D7G8_STREX
MSRYEAASRVLREALGAAERAGAADTALAIAARLAEALNREGGQEEAVALMERARAEEAGQYLLVVETTAVLALALGLSGEAGRAAAAFTDAGARAEALPYPSGLARVRAARKSLSVPGRSRDAAGT